MTHCLGYYCFHQLIEVASEMKKLFSEIPTLEGNGITLGPVIESDAPALQELMDNENVYRYLPTFLFEKRFEDARDAVNQFYGELFESKESLILGIREVGDGSFCGLAEFYGLRDDVHKISIGYRLRESCWGHGVATRAVALMVGYLYGQTDIEIITASTMVENYASARVLEKNDFIRTARGVEEDWGFELPTIADKWFC